MEGRRKFKDNDEKFNSTKQLTNVGVAVEGKSMVTNKTTVVAVEEKARSSPGKKRREYLEYRRYSSTTRNGKILDLSGKKLDFTGIKPGSIKKLLETIGHGTSINFKRRQNKFYHSIKVIASFYSSVIAKSINSTTYYGGRRRYQRVYLQQKMMTKINQLSLTSPQPKSNGENKSLYVGGNDNGIKQNTAISENSKRSSKVILSDEIDELADLFGKLTIVDIEEESLPYLSRTEINAKMKQNIINVLESILEEIKHQSSTTFSNIVKTTNNKRQMTKKGQQYKGKWLLRNYM